MASLSTSAKGHRVIQFSGPDGKRQTLRLGRIAQRDARIVLHHVQKLLSAVIVNHAVDEDTSRWLTRIDDWLIDRLARVGLTKLRPQRRLGEWLEEFIAERKAHLKPASIVKLEQTKEKLLNHFAPNRGLRTITADDAAKWRAYLVGLGLSEATLKIHAGNAKTLLNAAVEREHIDRNPFRHLPSGPTPSRYDRFVDQKQLAAILEQLGSAEARVAVGLARLAGLRHDSETRALRWDCVDWAKARLQVFSPKTERHEGHAERLVPICPWLLKLLQERYDQAAAGEVHLLTTKGRSTINRRVEKAIDLAGVTKWKFLWQTLRRSCEQDWAMMYPQYAVSRWMGHSIVVSGRHYTPVPDVLFDLAAGKASVSALQIPTQEPSETSGNDGKVREAS